MKYPYLRPQDLRQLFAAGIATAALLMPSGAFAQLPKPAYGWNLGNTMEPPSGVGTWGGTPTQALINSVAAHGFNTVRIPCAWDCHADKTTHLIDPAYMSQVKQVVDWCIAKNLYVVINDHWDDGWLENNIGATVNPAIDTKMDSYWTQIAKTFSGYNDHLLFAAANEPNVKTADKMATLTAYYQTFVKAVRSAGGNNGSRWLVLQGPDADFDTTDKLMNTFPTDPTPGRLMVEVHYYSPYTFCLMNGDASWGKMAYFWGQGYHSSALPSRNATFGEEADMDAEFQKMYAKFTSKGIPVIVGECRAEPRGSAGNPGLTGDYVALNHASSTYWSKYLLDSAHSHGMTPIYWDTPGQTFNWTTGAVVDAAALASMTGGPAVPPAGGDGAIECFELSTQNWASSGSPIAGVVKSDAQKYAGAYSLAVNFDGAAGSAAATVAAPSVPAGQTITFHLWIPKGSKITAVQAFEVDHNGVRKGSRRPIGKLTTDAWNTITVIVPSKAATPLQGLGVQFSTGAGWTGACYIDSVNW